MDGMNNSQTVYQCSSAHIHSRYQGVVADRYGLPNDEVEQLREGIKHRLYLDHILKGEYFLAPVGDRPQKIVDLGTGTGIWAMEGLPPANQPIRNAVAFADFSLWQSPRSFPVPGSLERISPLYSLVGPRQI